MKKTMVLALGALAVVACGNGDDDDSGASGTGDSLVHTWVYTSANGATGTGLTLTADGKYIAEEIVLTSSTTANVQEDEGTYSVSGSTITFTPEESSCTGPDAPLTAQFGLTATVLTVQYSTGAIEFQVDTSTGANAALTIGCFDNGTGAFTPTPLAPVSDD